MDRTPSDKHLEDLTSPIRKSNKIGLNTLHTDLKDLKTSLERTVTGQDPAPGRTPLSNVIPFSDYKVRTNLNNTGSQTDAEPDRIDRLQRLGNTIQEKIGIERGGSLNNTQTNINASIFDKFIKQSKEQETLLKGANEEQRQIFQQLEQTLVELRGAGSKDSEKLRGTLAELRGRLDATDDTEAKGKIAYRMDTAGGNAKPANLGNVIKALMGKDSLLKTGYEREGKNIRNTETGQFTSRAEASQGRLSSAFGMLGNYVGQKAEEGVEGKRSERFQGFLDRNFRTESDADRVARLGGEIQGLKTAGATTSTVSPPKPIAATMTRSSSAGATKANVVNINAAKVNLSGNVGAAAAPVTDVAPKITEKIRPQVNLATAAAATPVAAEEGSGLGLGDIASTATTGGGYLAKIGGLGTVAKGVGIGGAAALVGTGLQYGGDKLKEAGYEKTGKAVGVAGTATKYAGYGAMIGSVVPGVGTAIGAGVGGVIGAGKGIYDQYFAEGANKPTTEDAHSMRIDTSDPNKPKYLVDEKEVDADTYTKISNMDPVEQVEAVKNLKGNQVQNLSSQNDAAKTAKANTPIVVPVPSNTGAAAAKPTTSLPRGTMRPSESALERYTARGSSFY